MYDIWNIIKIELQDWRVIVWMITSIRNWLYWDQYEIWWMLFTAEELDLFIVKK